MESTIQTDIVRRLRCIGGHTRALRRMVADQDECLQIVHQLIAVQGALKKVQLLLIEEYLFNNLPESTGSLTQEESDEIIDRCEELLAVGPRSTD